MLRELAERGSVAATASALHLSPSAVSQQLATLSRQLGVRLLDRAGRGVRLTAEANLLLDHAAELNAQLERARADLAAHAAGDVATVVIGTFATAIPILVAPAMAALADSRPRLSLVVREVQAPGCFTRLDAGEVDLVITVDWRGGPTRNDPRYHRFELFTDPLDALLPPGHRLAVGKTLELIDLAEETWVTGAPGGPCVEITLAACAAAGFNPQVRHHSEDWYAVGALVAAGAGVTLAPRSALAQLPASVAVRPLDGSQPVRRIFAAVRAGSERASALQCVVSALHDAAHRRAKSEG